MTEDIKLVHSPLTQICSADGHRVSIEIYRTPDSAWVLEVVDEHGTSTVWDEPFETDKAALEAAFLAIEEEGLASFVAQAQQGAEQAEAEPKRMRKLERAAPGGQEFDHLMVPLSDEELDELDQLLLHQESEECMTLPMLDGFLHALAIGPETVMPSRWLPKVWGEEGLQLPEGGEEEFGRVLNLLMRHFNSVIAGFQQHPPFVEPLWETFSHDELGEFEDGDAWAYGFCEGVGLSRAAWQPMLRDPQGALWFRTIGLLGEDGFSPDQDALTRTPEQRQELVREIPDSLARIHAYWQSVRRAVAEHRQARRMSPKTGRNESCPCGSGKKFKKCCGAPSRLH